MDSGRGANPLIDVVIEIPKGSRNKYEYDHTHHVIRLDRRLFSATVYPADYGFLPDTLAEDSDPLDALVLLEDPTFPGCWVKARVLGLFSMVDENGPDAKILTVLDGDPLWEHVRSLDDLPHHMLDEIRHFFDVYKELEPGKSTEVLGFGDADEAWRIIDEARQRFSQSPEASSTSHHPASG
jgi:inorganic pyrophosphatase